LSAKIEADMAEKRDFYGVLSARRKTSGLLTKYQKFATIKAHHPVLSVGLSGAFLWGAA
jgi:hypothetical protein